MPKKSLKKLKKKSVAELVFMPRISEKAPVLIQGKRGIAGKIRRFTGSRFFPFKKSPDSVALRHVVQETAKQVEKEFCKKGQFLIATVFGSVQKGYADKIKSDADVFVCVVGNFSEPNLKRIKERLNDCYIENYSKKFGKNQTKIKLENLPASMFADFGIYSFNEISSEHSVPGQNSAIAKLFCQSSYGNVRNVRKMVLEKLAKRPDAENCWNEVKKWWSRVSGFYGGKMGEISQLSKLNSFDASTVFSESPGIVEQLPSFYEMLELYGLKRRKD